MSLLTPDFRLLFWMLLSFLIVFGLLTKFGFPVITRMVNERREYIQQSLAAADEANRRLAEIRMESEGILNEARVRQSELIRQATAESDKMILDAKEKAAAEAQKQLDEAMRQIDAQKQQAVSDIRGQVARLSVDIAEKVLRRQLDDPARQEIFIAHLLDEIEKN